MDFIIYLVVLLLMGFIRVRKTSMVSEDEGIVDTGVDTIEICSLPISQNLELKRDPNAFLLIPKQLGLL